MYSTYLKDIFTSLKTIADTIRSFLRGTDMHYLVHGMFFKSSTIMVVFLCARPTCICAYNRPTGFYFNFPWSEGTTPDDAKRRQNGISKKRVRAPKKKGKRIKRAFMVIVAYIFRIPKSLKIQISQANMYVLCKYDYASVRKCTCV